MAYDDNADIEENDTLDFACEECGCEFEVTFNNPTVYITKKSTKEGGE